MKLYGDPFSNGWVKAACADSRALEVWEEVVEMEPNIEFNPPSVILRH